MKAAILAIASAAACKPAPTHPDAALADARTDAIYACDDYPSPDAQLCPSFQPYCCSFVQYLLCSADSRMGACTESPINGLRQACDRSNGQGCPSDHAVCCGIGDITFCSDHVYTGAWECSPAP